MSRNHTLKTGTLIRLILFTFAAGSGLALVTQKAVFSTAKMNTARPVVHFEIGCRDQARTNEFYSKLFDWQIGAGGMINGAEGGITGHTTSLGHEPYNYVTVYVQVDDIPAYLEKAKSLGGKVIVPAVKIPTGRFAWMADPEGNMIGLLEP